MTTANPTFLALQGALAGRFSLEAELGRGGMGIVYLARDVLLERPVAIKLLAPALAARADMRRRFLREARLAAQCFHPHIVPIHEVAEQGELAWFVMGYVAGETLADRLRRAGSLPPDTIRRIGREIGWALSYAHERGVVHRDVKPENILLEQGSDRALIADFGIAVGGTAVGGTAVGGTAVGGTAVGGTAVGGADPLASGEVAGTARFMAPEQALGEAVDGRADLYALGVTLYLAATGRYPHEGTTAVAVMLQQQTAAPAPVRSLARALPDDLGDAIDRCLASRPADRFDDAHAFVAALERTRAGDDLPREAREVRTGIVAAMSLTDWLAAIGLAGFFLIGGEESRSLGRAIMSGIVQWTMLLFGTAAAWRGGEALLALRRAARAGLPGTVLTDALAPGPTSPERPLGPLAGTAMLAGAFALALAQAQVDPLGLPAIPEMVGNLLTWFVPPVLVHRAITGMRRTSGVSGWLYSVVRKPLAARIVGWFTGRHPAEPMRPVPASLATELLLGQAADEIFARLSTSQQAAVRALPAATARLAEEAAALRARVVAISDAQRVVRHAGDAVQAAKLLDERRAAEGRLGTTIAALEAIRLDLLRLEALRTQPGGLTADLDVVRELQRRVDAQAAVRALLAGEPLPLAPEPTPV